jgi:hypothetical protein
VLHTVSALGVYHDHDTPVDVRATIGSVWPGDTPDRGGRK